MNRHIKDEECNCCGGKGGILGLYIIVTIIGESNLLYCSPKCFDQYLKQEQKQQEKKGS